MAGFDETFYAQLDARGFAKADDGWWVAVPGMVDGQIPIQGQNGGPVWDVIEHDDGTITVHPSINCQDGETSWHGYLRRGAWEPV